jgi:hypothetical protein
VASEALEASVEAGEVGVLEGGDDVSRVRRAQAEADLFRDVYEVLELLLLGFVHPTTSAHEPLSDDQSCEDVSRRDFQARLHVHDLVDWNAAQHLQHLVRSHMFRFFNPPPARELRVKNLPQLTRRRCDIRKCNICAQLYMLLKSS